MSSQSSSSNSSSSHLPETQFREYIPRKGGLTFASESGTQPILCKPKLLPLKSFTLEKLEQMQEESQAKAALLLREEESEESSTNCFVFHQNETSQICYPPYSILPANVLPNLWRIVYWTSQFLNVACTSLNEILYTSWRVWIWREA
ncbi:BBIP1 [Lepeophtheirus salmonis]|uniref:BBIP1 n=1 Tax=Lepeophtheirus salmonis TaxID=72036 RepID=A0A7R8CYT6_LEPSM|nr:BBIP1 [Lepeophtheirus salmonis]CAF2926982.1 BBIP1 [Lepeophtheirus salmonis]